MTDSMLFSMARHRDNCPLDCKVYVGELGNNGSRQELEDAFGYYGPLKNVWVARNPPGFAFVMFEDTRDARDACRALNGKVICGRRVRVELSSGKTRREMGDDGPDGGSRGPPPPRDRYREDRYERSPPPRYASGGSRDYGRDRSPLPPPRMERRRTPPRDPYPPSTGTSRGYDSDPYYRGRGGPPPKRPMRSRYAFG